MSSAGPCLCGDFTDSEANFLLQGCKPPPHPPLRPQLRYVGFPGASGTSTRKYTGMEAENAEKTQGWSLQTHPGH